MSLVNDMLEDLDRRSDRGDLPPRATGLQAASGHRRLRRLVWICVGHGTLAIGGIAAVTWIALVPVNEFRNAQHPIQSPQAQVEAFEVAALPPVESAPPAPPAPKVPGASPRVAEQQAPTPTPVALPPSVPQVVTMVAPPPAAPRAFLPPDPDPTPVGSELSSRSELISESAIDDAPDRTPSNSELAAELVDEGEQLLAIGRLDAGIDAWRRALKLDPTRVSLYPKGAARLIAAGVPARARAWLEPGRLASPLDPALRMLAARLELEIEGPAEALELLEAPLPDVEEARELHSLRAALLAREQRHLEALDAYRTLVAAHPGRGRLWFGLAISAEALGREAEAGVALHHSLEDPELPAALVRYAKQRTVVLDRTETPEASR
ncbi:MAG: tetratricopeptide repeat protein [bacterium]|nr:tetratricopeptide repeat protein [bacterium]